MAFKLTNKIIGLNFSWKTWNFSWNENFRIFVFFSNFNYRLFFLISCFVKVEQIGSLCQEKQTVEYYNWKESFQRSHFSKDVLWHASQVANYRYFTIIKIMQRGGLNQTFWNWTWTNMNVSSCSPLSLNLGKFIQKFCLKFPFSGSLARRSDRVTGKLIHVWLRIRELLFFD